MRQKFLIALGPLQRGRRHPQRLEPQEHGGLDDLLDDPSAPLSLIHI